METAVVNNVNLITSIKTDFIKEIGDVIRGSVYEGKRHTDMIGLIKERVIEGGEARARLIARDQTAKLNSELTRKRHESIGINLYIWRTGGDERVRTSHALLNRMLCKYDDSTVYSDDDGRTWKDRTEDMVHLHPGEDYQCRCIQIPHVVIEDRKTLADSKVFKEEDVNRNEKGQFASEGGGGKTSDEEKQKKIDSIRIDFDAEVNELPGLNTEDLSAMGEEDRPVSIHKRVFEKHPEVSAEDVPVILGALYSPEAVLPANKDKPYFNFISGVGENKNSVVLLGVEKTKAGFEVAGFHWMGDR